MIHDLMTKEITLIEVGITNKDILAKVESEKSLKYQLLANELKCLYPGTTVTIIPVVMTWDGLVTRYFKHYMKQLDVKQRLLAYIQTVVLKKTCENILGEKNKQMSYIHVIVHDTANVYGTCWLVGLQANHPLGGEHYGQKDLQSKRIGNVQRDTHEVFDRDEGTLHRQRCRQIGRASCRERV